MGMLICDSKQRIIIHLRHIQKPGLRTMSVDVTVATLNSGRTIERCLKAIRSNIPVRRLVIVDGGSTDDTVDIARRYNAELIVERGLLGRVRYVQAQNCGTDWIAFVDSDVYVYPSWWLEVSKFAKEPMVGMIIGMCDSPIVRLPIYEDYMGYLITKHGAVAFSNTLIRRDVMLSCKKLLGPIHAGEDTVLAKHLSNVQMRILTVHKRLAYHDKSGTLEHPSAYYRWGQSSRLIGGKQGVKNIAKTLRNNVRNWISFSKESKEISLKLLMFLIYLWVCSLEGYINGYPRHIES